MKKAQLGAKTKSTPADSTSYFAGRVAKAEGLYDKAQAEKLGKTYEQGYKDNLFTRIGEQRSYKQRQAATEAPPKSTASLKKGGKVPKKSCAKCGKTIKK